MYAVLGFKGFKAARSTASSDGSADAVAGLQAEGGTAIKAAGAAGEGVADTSAPLRQVLASVLQSVRAGGMRTGKAREWVLLLWALAKVCVAPAAVLVGAWVMGAEAC